jgi:hypothetical protein
VPTSPTIKVAWTSPASYPARLRPNGHVRRHVRAGMLFWMVSYPIWLVVEPVTSAVLPLEACSHGSRWSAPRRTTPHPRPRARSWRAHACHRSSACGQHSSTALDARSCRRASCSVSVSVACSGSGGRSFRHLWQARRRRRPKRPMRPRDPCRLLLLSHVPSWPRARTGRLRSDDRSSPRGTPRDIPDTASALRSAPSSPGRRTGCDRRSGPCRAPYESAMSVLWPRDGWQMTGGQTSTFLRSRVEVAESVSDVGGQLRRFSRGLPRVKRFGSHPL